MKAEILKHINDPHQLEKLYRSHKGNFKRDFDLLYPEISGLPLAEAWKERLHYEGEDISWGSRKELFTVIILAVIAGFIAKIPSIFSINEEFFYSRNIGFIVFPAITIYFAWKHKLAERKLMIVAALVVAGAIFINLLPDNRTSNTLILSSIHIVFFLWAILGFSFSDIKGSDTAGRLGYLKYNGDLVVMTTLIVIAGGIMTAITIGLFSLIGINIERFWFENIVVFGLPAAPIIGTFLIQTNPQLVGKVSPVIARLFSPLVLVMLVVYLVAIAFSGKDPYNDRDFLMLFNGLLIGVMAIIFFSIAETSRAVKGQWEIWLLFLLSVVTLIVNGVALSAIIFRISEWGITPNRAAVTGANLLMLINLALVTIKLYKTLTRKQEAGSVGQVIASYLPVYVLWTIVVVFVFPFVFGFA